MIKNLTLFKSVVQGIENYFHFDANCPINVAKESVLECLKWLGQVEDAIKAQEEKKASENPEPSSEQNNEGANAEPSN